MVQDSVSSQDDATTKPGKIFNSININKKEKITEEEITIEENSNVMKPAQDEDEDDWSAVPAFLRRSKNR